jgi:superfamily I DNA/RNA helicase
MDFLNDAELPPISSYQENAIIELKTNNIIIDSVAGCGKTTTNMYIGKIFNTSNILLLTYNSKLKLETREKVKIYGISNIEIHSYHSFCVKNYDRECFTDEKLIHVLENNQPPFNDFDYDIIILDEAQDINPTLYNLICKIYKDNKSNSKLCVLGDKNQSIYDFNFADSRYITFADIIFNFNKLRWSKCTLPFSFRITHEMAEFINNCMMDKPRIYSKKISDDKPDYICCNI